MKKIFLLIFIALAPLFSQAQSNVKITTKPYLQAVGETEFTVMWITDTDAVAWVEVAPDDGTHFYGSERPKYYQNVFGRRPIGKLHKVKVSGLEPGTSYRYRVMMQSVSGYDGRKITYGVSRGSDVYRGKPYKVTTLDPAKDEITFSVVNDLHGNDKVLRDIFTSALHKNKYDFVFFNGDLMSYVDSEETLTSSFLNTSAELFASETPLFLARGNHEFRGAFAIDCLDYFSTANDLPYYTFQHGPAFFIVLDSGEDKPDSDIENKGLVLCDDFRIEESEWLKGVLESEEFKQAPIRIVFCHMPPRPKGWHGGAEVSRLFVPLLNKAGIDLMLCGHTHSYAYEEAGKTSNGCDFPVLINANLHRLDAEVSGSGIDIKIYNSVGTRKKSIKIRKKKSGASILERLLEDDTADEALETTAD